MKKSYVLFNVAVLGALLTASILSGKKQEGIEVQRDTEKIDYPTEPCKKCALDIEIKKHALEEALGRLQMWKCHEQVYSNEKDKEKRHAAAQLKVQEAQKKCEECRRALHQAEEKSIHCNQNILYLKGKHNKVISQKRNERIRS